ncbi:hypothetical protein FRC03_008956 [Tulasnella sp. 419]|nr:hypothetical protein FRC03_008956 [Tulasnella sp. 419]
MVYSRLITLVATVGLIGAASAQQLPKAQVYFYPPDPTLHHEAPAVNPTEANLLLAQHLGFDLGEIVGEDMNGDWAELIPPSSANVGEGHRGSTLIVVQSDHPEDFIPHKVKPTFVIPNPPKASEFTDLIHAYVEKAHHLFSDVFSSLEESITSSSAYKGLLDLFDMASHAASMFVDELGRMLELVDGEDEPDEGSDQFSAFQVNGLAEIQKEHGRDSEEYATAARSMEAFFSNPSLQSRQVAIIVVPSEKTSHSRRSAESETILSTNSNKIVFSVSTCYKDNNTCVEATSGCSGHGSCNQVTKAGKSCFTCSCAVTEDSKGRKQHWAGLSCEKKDISTSFTLLAGSTIFLILLIGFSISLLYSIGEEALPSTLTAAASAPHGIKRD